MPNSTERPASWSDVARHTQAALPDRQEALWIVERASGLSTAELLGNNERPSELAWNHVVAMIENRNQGTPIQYVLGRWQFRNLELAVSPQALIPRPETEQLVDWALVAAQQSPPLRLALDLGTGSGAIALSLATEVDNLEVWATELSPAAATLARANLAGIGGRAATRVRILDGSWFEPLSEHLRDSFDLIVANPPYLAHAEMAELDASVRDFEPHESLFSGPTGTEDLRLIVDEARSWLRKGGTLALEMSPWQTDELAKYMQSSGYQQVVVHTDLAGLQRSVTAHS